MVHSVVGYLVLSLAVKSIIGCTSQMDLWKKAKILTSFRFTALSAFSSNMQQLVVIHAQINTNQL